MTSFSEEIELLDRVLFRLGCAQTDEKLESTVNRFLAPVILKLNSPLDNVRTKVLEVLTHIKRRLTSRPLVKIPVETLLDQYKSSENCPYLQNFATVFIIMGYPRLSLEDQIALAPKVITCEEKLENYIDKFLMLLIPNLGNLNLPDNIFKVDNFLHLKDKPVTRNRFLTILQDILLLPYNMSQHQGVPPGMSLYSFRRVTVKNLTAEELENIKKGIIRYVTSGIFSEKEIFILLLIASSDTRLSVATPANTELCKACTSLDFTDPTVTESLYLLFSGSNSTDSEHKTSPCCARVRQKLLQYLIKCRDKGLNSTRGIQVLFEGMFGENTDHKCKILALQFGEILINNGPIELISKLATVILMGISKVISQESNEPIDIKIAAYSAIAQLSRKYPYVVNNDLKLVISYFENLVSSPRELQASIREALVAMASAFCWQFKLDGQKGEELNVSGQLPLLLAMLSDSAESKVLVVQNVTSVFLTTCFPEYYAPSRYLLLLIAGERNSLHENITTYLYGVSKKDLICYNVLSSIEHQEKLYDNNQKSKDQKYIVLPSFKAMMRQINDMMTKRCARKLAVGEQNKLPFNFNTCEEILDYLRMCLWYSAGVKSFPGDEKHIQKIKKFIEVNYDNSKENVIYQYMQFIQSSIETKRVETNLRCLYDLLTAAPKLLSKNSLHLLEPLTISLSDASETIRINVAKIIGILMAYTCNDCEFNKKVEDCIQNFSQKSLESKQGWIFILGYAFGRKIQHLNENNSKLNLNEWQQLIDTIKLIIKILNGVQWLLVSAALESITLIGKIVQIPDITVDIKCDDDAEKGTIDKAFSAKFLLFNAVFNIVRDTSIRSKIRELAAKCMGHLAIGDGKYFTIRNLEKLLSLAKIQNDIALNLSIADAIVSTLNGYDLHVDPSPHNFVNKYCDSVAFDLFINSLIEYAYEPNPLIRQACAVWLLSVVKHCHHNSTLLKKCQLLQFAFLELLSDESEFVQEVASRGLHLVFKLSDHRSQNDLANTLVAQLIGGKKSLNQETENTKVSRRTACRGNLATYKELCVLASDLNQPEIIYQFMPLANRNASWSSRLDAAFDFKCLSNEEKEKMKPYLGKIIPRLYRYKYDPTPKIQNSMMSIWDSIVIDSKEVVDTYYWEILNEIIKNLTCNDWSVRIACCLAVRDLLKLTNLLRLRSEEQSSQKTVQEPEIMELWSQLFRVMDDIHEETRQAATGSVKLLSKLCISAASSNFGKSAYAIASSILPLLLCIGLTNTVPDIRNLSIQTIIGMIDSSGPLIAPHFPLLIPCLLKATGELESSKLSYISVRLGADNNAQESVDAMRAELAKTNPTMDAITKCVSFVDYVALEKMTPDIMELMKITAAMGTKIACAHFICLVIMRLNKEMTPLVSKYLAVCFIGLKDRNLTVTKYFATAIGHLIAYAKEKSVKNLLIKLDELYMENSVNRSIVQTIVSINKHNHEFLKDYWENVLPLVFFAMHEEKTDENMVHIEMWKDLWTDISPGDAGIRLNLNVIISKIEISMLGADWSRKTQSANAIHSIAVRLSDTLPESDRLKLLDLLLNGLQGRTFLGKQRLLGGLAELCKSLNPNHEICERIIDSTMRECRKKEYIYRIAAIAALGKILEQLEIDRFEEVYNMIWYILESKDFRDEENSDEEGVIYITTDERNNRTNTLNRLKEHVCITLGQAWPKNSLKTQEKFQILFAERCSLCLRNNTRPVQVSLLGALIKFIERLLIFDNSYIGNVEIDENQRNSIVKQICNYILSSVIYVSGIPHTGLKKESLNIYLVLIERLRNANDSNTIVLIKKVFEDNLEKYQKDSAPEVRCRIKDIEEKLSKF